MICNKPFLSAPKNNYRYTHICIQTDHILHKCCTLTQLPVCSPAGTITLGAARSCCHYTAAAGDWGWIHEGSMLCGLSDFNLSVTSESCVFVCQYRIWITTLLTEAHWTWGNVNCFISAGHRACGCRYSKALSNILHTMATPRHRRWGACMHTTSTTVMLRYTPEQVHYMSLFSAVRIAKLLQQQCCLQSYRIK